MMETTAYISDYWDNFLPTATVCWAAALHNWEALSKILDTESNNP
jgi:hypothetical protein